MKYKKEIDNLLKELYFDETTMTEEDYNEKLSKIEGIESQKQNLSNYFQLAESLGITVEHQMSMFKIMYKELNKQMREKVDKE